MPNESHKLSRNDFNRLVDRLLLGETALESEAQHDPVLHLKRGVHHETLLHFFAVESRPDLVRKLAGLGAELDTENEFGNTPLVESIMKDDLVMAELLLELGANPNYQSSRDKNTPLHVAADYERQGALDVLLRAGANTNLRNKYSETAAELIAKNGLKGTTEGSCS